MTGPDQATSSTTSPSGRILGIQKTVRLLLWLRRVNRRGLALVESTVYQVLLNLVAAAIGWLASVAFNALKRQRIRSRRMRAFCDFFGSSRHLVVIHSAVLDGPSPNSVGLSVDYPVYNYPATDIELLGCWFNCSSRLA